MIAGLLPPTATGAVQMLISVWSAAVKLSSLTKVSPALSVTALMVAELAFQTPTSTMSRLPATVLAAGSRPNRGGGLVRGHLLHECGRVGRV